MKNSKMWCQHKWKKKLQIYIIFEMCHMQWNVTILDSGGGKTSGYLLYLCTITVVIYLRYLSYICAIYHISMLIYSEHPTEK